MRGVQMHPQPKGHWPDPGLGMKVEFFGKGLKAWSQSLALLVHCRSTGFFFLLHSLKRSGRTLSGFCLLGGCHHGIIQPTLAFEPVAHLRHKAALFTLPGLRCHEVPDTGFNFCQGRKLLLPHKVQPR